MTDIQTPKEILLDIMNAFCLSTQNLDKVYKLSGIKGRLYNGKRSNEQHRKIILRAITDDKAREIINQMPFPYIETAYGHYERERERLDYWEDILVPLPKIKGYRLECVSQNFATFYR